VHASSPLRHLAALGALAAAAFVGLAVHADTAEAGPGAGRPARWAIAADTTDSTRTADSLRAVAAFEAGDLGLADSLFAALGDRAVLRPSAVPGDTVVPAPIAAADTVIADTTVAGRAVADTFAVAVRPVMLAAADPDAPADTVRTDTTRRALEYLPGIPTTGTGVASVERRLPGIRGTRGGYWQRQTTLDSTEYTYTVRESIGGEDVRVPAILTLEQFVAAQRRASLQTGFRTLATQRADRGRRRAGVGITVDIPGGEQSAFRTLFGKNEVDLTVNGRSNVNLGVAYNQSDLQDAISARPGGSLAPDFAQELNLNVAGTIGDKLRINVNYDTESQFNFENQVSLVYTGYEDDIIQRIEAGNVLLQTPSELIQGGQRLFGLRTDLRFGPLALTAVASQQDAETSEVVIEGGSQATPFSIPPTDYEDNTHFFLAYAFHNTWDGAHVEPGTRTLPPGFREIVGIEVFRHDQSVLGTPAPGDEIITAVALADLAEPGGTAPTPEGRETGLSVLRGGRAYLAQFSGPGQDPFRDTPLPDSLIDVYSEADLDRIRTDLQLSPAAYGVPPGGSASGAFRRLRRDIDFTFDAQLGTLSLTSALQENDFLAVAYQYRLNDAAGTIVTVGDFGETRNAAQERSVLKLLRADRPVPAQPTWDLTMRNIYRIGGRSLTPTAFTLGLTYEASGGAPSTEFPDITFGNAQTLLQVLGLDRTNIQGDPTPDELFDFSNGLTVNAESGRIIFPVRQPFGDFLDRLIREGRTVSGQTIDRTPPPNGTLAEAATRYAFPQLYTTEASLARTQFPALSRYRIGGEFRSAAQSVFNVGFNLVQGTVRVTSGGQPLVENTDFRVNYSAGTVEIVNPALLQNGRQVRVQVEQNQIVAIGSKTLLGLRADYRVAENTTFGATLMRLSERPLVDKFNIGTEAIDNTVLGFDARYIAEPRWITRALDFLPLLQTRAPSRVELRGEFARLNPGHPQTLAFSQTVRRLADDGDVELPEDELRGLSYVDDFEGSENAYSQLGDAGGWRIAGPPVTSGPEGSITPGIELTQPEQVGDPRYRHNWRGLFAWYALNEAAYTEFNRAGLLTHATQPLAARDLFPDRYRNVTGTNGEATRPLGLLDLYFDPTRRGPYNYNNDLGGVFAANPRDVWGGMIRQLPGNYSNFAGQNNVEFIEMIVAAVGGRDGTEDIGDSARLYIDLGELNEDVVPDRYNSGEDGLRDPNAVTPGDLTPFGRRSLSPLSGSIDVFESGRTEDLGLDGLPSQEGDVVEGGTPYPAALAETNFFRFFLDSNLPAAERARANDDPSGDDYHHFRDGPYFDDASRFPLPAAPGQPAGASVQERYGQYLPAFELNSVQAQSDIARSGQDGISTLPNTEDLDGDLSADLADAYHRYEIPLDRAGLLASPFFQNVIPIETGRSAGETYYLLRIPVRTENRRTVGLDRDNFSRISTVRVWTTGHDRPATIRIPSFQLVGSPWLQSTRVGTAEDVVGTPPGPDPRLFVATVNNEESPTTYARPRQAVYRTTAQASVGGTAGGLAREQALVLRAETLADGRTAGIQRSYTTRPLDLTRYQNLRMYVHGHGFERSDSMRVVIRIGDDETENYYEYEQPIYPFELDDAARITVDDVRADSLWQTATAARSDRNSVNILLSELNKLKVARDAAGAALDEVYPRAGSPAARPDGAPPGARISIRGQPSIQDVRSVVLGVRNGVGGRVTPVDTVEVWYNELRVSGYDEEAGASGFLVANVTLADIGAVQARFSQTQDGFGGLSGGLGEREFADRTAVSLTSSFNLHRLLPARFGWSIPVSYSLTANEATPRYDPRRGDIRLTDLVEQTLDDSTANAPPQAEREITAASIVERAQTVTGTRNFRVQFSKTGSRSPWLRYTLDGLSAAYSSTAQTARDPSNAFNDADSWAANLNYRVAVPRPKTVLPFWFTRGIPLVRALSGLRLNVLPQTVSFATDARRNMSQIQTRLVTETLGEPDSVRAFRTRTRRTQLFDHGRQTDLQYNPFPFLQLGYGSNTDQDLGAAGQNESFRILVRDATGRYQTFNISPEAARDSNSVVRQFFGIDNSALAYSGLTVLGGQELGVVPAGQVLAGILSGERDVRTRSYSQSLTAALRVSTARVRWLSWIRPQAISYQAAYQWSDIPIASQPLLDVSGAGTRVQLQTGLQLVPTEFWRLFPFYRRIEAGAGRGPGGGRGRQPAPTDTSGARRGFNPASIGRGLFLAATGLTDVSVTYRGSFSSSAGGLVGDSYSLLSGLTGAAPGIGYRLGLVRSLPLDRRLTDPTVNLQYNDLLEDRHAIDARTTVEPFPQLRIGLTWQTSFGATARLPYAFTDGGGVTALPAERIGSGESTIYAFGGSYESLLARHTQRFLDDTNGGTPGASYESEFLLRTGIAADFQSEFAHGLGAFGPRGLFPIPVPGWDISYSGLGNLPLVRRIAQQITLRHNYSATSRSDYATFFATDNQLRPVEVAGGGIVNLTASPADAGLGSAEPNVITVNERFQPLLGASVGLRGGIQTDVTWNRSNLFTLQATSAQVTEKNIEEIQVQFSYAKTGLRLLGLRRLNNNLRLSLSASYGTDNTVLRNMRADLLNVLAGRDPDEVAAVSQRRLQLFPRISYTISNQVTADVFVRYERSNPTGGPNAFATRKVDGGVSLRILFSN
jgi:cell surface protein SprA